MSAPPMSAPLSSARRRRVFVVLVAAAALTILDVSKLGIALPAIQDDMGGDPATVQLMLVGYTLAYAVTLVPAGRIGDVLRRRTVFLVGASIFVVASIACAAAPTAELLVAGRVVEGVGAGLLMPQVLGIIQRMYPASERARPLATLAAVLTVTSLGAPVLAGVIMNLAGDALGWRLLFVVTVVAGLVVVPVAATMIVEPPSVRRAGFDAVGALLLGLGVVAAIAPLSASSGALPATPWPYAITAAGVVVLGAFMLYERLVVRRGREPLIDPRLFALPHFGAGVAVSGFMHAAATGGTLIVTIALQQVAGLSPLETALWMLPTTVASLLGAWIASRAGATDGPLIAIGIGVSAVTLAAIGLAFGFVPAGALPVVVVALLSLSSLGAGAAAPANQARTLQFAPEHRSSVAGSLIQFSQRSGSAVGMAAALVVYYTLFSSPTPGGQPAAGPMLALLLVSGLLAIGGMIALADHLRHPGGDRRHHTPNDVSHDASPDAARSTSARTAPLVGHGSAPEQ
ncbi:MULTISPECIES: MFS transporter [Microbacterium]|uniref:MFS transporter n=1 Tax=Microbacterium TaxID=33882 RepID=UPI0027870086|nr:MULTISPECIES: MFS transporter [Microbacterium]MDQ1083708.1 MFS family permease [Microbacterium sp. SORGH_AS_0344]MDQ1171015.1 MFS family permease [Microbacterium proteolyticum]